MRSSKKIYQYIIEAYNALYAASIPSVSFDELSANCTTYVDDDNKEVITEAPLTMDEMQIQGLRKKINFYAYYLPEENYQKIVTKIEKKHRLKKMEQTTFRFHAYLGCGPTSSVDRWLEEHPESTYDDLLKLCKELGYTDIRKPKDYVNKDEEKQYC